MNRKLQKNTQPLAYLKKNLLLYAVLISSMGVKAQMSGTYSIDAANAASSSNFRSWQSLWQSLQGVSRADAGPAFTGGVTGAVTVNVQSSLTETVAVQFPVITGVSSTNTITINGNSNFVAFAGTSATPATILLNGADFIRISALTIRNTGTVTNVQGIRFANAADNNSIQNCTIEFSALATGSSTAGGAYVAFSSVTSITGVTSGGGTNGFSNIIRNNLMRTTNSNSPGPAYGIFEVQNISTYTTTASNNSFLQNTIQNFFFWGINTYYTNGTVIAGNDISRANVSAGLPSITSGGINSYYNYATGRVIRADSNYIHDLPFAGSVAASSNASMHGMYVWYWFGTTSNPFSIKANRLLNITSATSGQGIYEGYSNNGRIELNFIENIRNNANSNVFSLYCIFGVKKDVLKNTIINNRPFGTYYGIYLFSVGGTKNRIYDNIIRDNISQAPTTNHIVYGLFAANGNMDVQRNWVLNLSQVSTSGSVFALRSQTSGADHLFANNIVSNCGGATNTYGFYHNTSTNTLVFRQNTINLTTTGGGNAFHNTYGIFGFGNGKTIIDGNIINTTNSYVVYPVYYGGSTTNMPVFNRNLYGVSNFTIQYWYNPLMGTKNTFKDWAASGLGDMMGEAFGRPFFKNVSTLDFRTDNFITQNNVNEDTAVASDITTNDRNKIQCDRGAVRNIMDLQNTAVAYNGGTTPCTGYSENLRITIKNNFSDTARNFAVSASINGKREIREIVNQIILPGQTITYTFKSPILFKNSGNLRLAVYIDMPDDIISNDSQVYLVKVRKSPGGAKMSPLTSVTTRTIYQSNKPFDVTVANESVAYEMTSPIAYSNADYNSKWSASAFVQTAGGNIRPVSEVILNAPASGNNLSVVWKTKDLNLEDSSVLVCVKYSDLLNGCDTVIKRRVLVNPLVVPDFKFPSKICDGEFTLLENMSKVKSGFIDYRWSFGTGKAEDTSFAAEPVFQFPGSGKYTVILEAKTNPYGFSSFDTSIVEISPVPTVNFSKVNACSGQDVVFKNLTTPVNSAMLWAMGDGTTSTQMNPKKKYSKPGSYIVTLSATLNGCASEISQRVYQFEKPVAKFDQLKGKCDNEEFEFNNTSEYKSGEIGSYWNFGDGIISTIESPKHQFLGNGNKLVKLYAISEFGCIDSFSKVVFVKESPKPSFTSGQNCANTEVDFLNLTLDVPSSVANYEWSFSGISQSIEKSPKVIWNSIGPKNVSLKVILDNGCAALVEKVIMVGIKPVVTFKANNACAGSPINFQNLTSFPQGIVSYSWNFGDNTFSTQSNPIKTYSDAIATTYFVTLKASIDGGCSDSFITSISVIEKPKTCDFMENTDYAFGFRGMKFKPMDDKGIVGAQKGVIYTWAISDNGSIKGDSAMVDFNFDKEYKVTMNAKFANGDCMCSKTKTVVMNRVSINGLNADNISVYPNPSNGKFVVKLNEKIQIGATAELYSLAGLKMATWNLNQGVNSLEVDAISSGMYILKIKRNTGEVTVKLSIQK